MFYSPEDLFRENEVVPAVASQEAEDLSLEQLGDLYKLPTIPSNISIGAAVLAGAMSAGIPTEAPAQALNSPEANVQTESAELKIKNEGTVNHPRLGSLKIQVYMKKVDMENPTFGGNSFGVRINGEEQTLAKYRSLRNGGAFYELINPTGEKITLKYPSIAEMSAGAKPKYISEQGEEFEIEK